MAGEPATYQFVWYRTLNKSPKRVAGVALMMTNFRLPRPFKGIWMRWDFFGILDMTSILRITTFGYMSWLCCCTYISLCWTFVLTNCSELCWTDVLTVDFFRTFLFETFPFWSFYEKFFFIIKNLRLNKLENLSSLLLALLLSGLLSVLKPVVIELIYCIWQ